MSALLFSEYDLKGNFTRSIKTKKILFLFSVRLIHSGRVPYMCKAQLSQGSNSFGDAFDSIACIFFVLTDFVEPLFDLL